MKGGNGCLRDLVWCPSLVRESITRPGTIVGEKAMRMFEEEKDPAEIAKMKAEPGRA